MDFARRSEEDVAGTERLAGFAVDEDALSLDDDIEFVLLVRLLGIA